MTKPTEPRHLHGKVICLMIEDHFHGYRPSVGIRWRVYGFGSQSLWLRSMDGSTTSKLSLQEFESLEQSNRLAVYLADPAPDIITAAMKGKAL